MTPLWAALAPHMALCAAVGIGAALCLTQDHHTRARPTPGHTAKEHDMTDQPTLDNVLTAGLHWLYETEQPETAWQDHHGLLLHGPDNRRYSFITADQRRRLPMVAVDVAKIEWIDNGPNELKTPAHPLDPGELAALAAALQALGCEVTSTWNGHPQTTGSVGLAQPAHSSLIAAVDRYHAGCLAHPLRGVFCDCDEWLTGSTRVNCPVPATA